VRRVVEELVFLLITYKVGRLDHVLEATTILEKLVDWLADHRVEEVLLYLSFGVDMEVVISVGNFAAIFIEFRRVFRDQFKLIKGGCLFLTAFQGPDHEAIGLSKFLLRS